MQSKSRQFRFSFPGEFVSRKIEWITCIFRHRIFSPTQQLIWIEWIRMSLTSNFVRVTHYMNKLLFSSFSHKLMWRWFNFLDFLKIATPARYTVTLGGTSLSVKYLRKHGYMSTPPPVKEYLQEKMEETKERISGKMEETKDRFSERMEETKDKFTEKLQETKDKVSFRKKKE